MSALDQQAFARVLPEYSVASLRQVLSLYGRLNYLSRGVTSFEGYQPYFTPGKVDDSMSVVVADLDLRDDDISVENVWVRGVETDDAIDRLGYSWYYAARGHDYSFTHRSSSSTGSTIANWLAAGLTNWAPADETPEYPEKVVNDHPDGWIINRLEETSDDTIDELKSAVESAAPTSNENKLLTARFRLSADEVESYDDSVEAENDSILAYPGDLDVCNAVTKAARAAGYKTMNSIKGESVGDGADMNSGEEDKLVGFATDHLKHYTSKQRERFPGFNANAAWQVHPVSEQEALYLDAAEDYLEACYSSFGRFRVYHLPYFRGTVTPIEGQALFDFLERLVDVRESETDRRASALSHFRDFAAQSDNQALEDIRFYTVFQHYEQKDRRNVFSEEPSIRVQPAEKIAEEHLKLLQSDIFGANGLPRDNSDTALTRVGIDSATVASTVESGWYLTRTFPEYVTGSDNDQAPATDDPRPKVAAELLSGGTVDTEFLLSEYIDKLADQYDGDGGNLRWRIAEQAAQLKTLAAAGMLEATDDTQQYLTEPPLMTNNEDDNSDQDTSATDAILGNENESDDSESESEQSVADRAREYVSRTPALNNSEDRAAAFLLGYTTGMMSRYQAGAEGMQRTFAARYPANDLTVTGAKRLYTELQGKAVTYADGAGSLYQDLIGELTEATPRAPDEWNLSLVDMRFHYGEGVALSLNLGNNSEE